MSSYEPYEINLNEWYWTNPIHGGKVGPFKTYAEADVDMADYLMDTPFE